MDNSKLISELVTQNKYLQNKLDELTKESSLKDEIVIQQSKMASMGEMIGNISHQWRQPLMEISTVLMNAEVKVKLIGKISNDDVLDTIYKSNNIIKYMSNTIDDFRNFFATNKAKENFLVTKQIETVVNLMNASIVAHEVKVNIIIKDNLEIYGYKNEYLQVLVNIISNAIDSLVSRKIAKPKINIKLYLKEYHCILDVEDNAQGIDLEDTSKVFEPFFTYKKKDGTGIGLFMSKLIVENNMNGRLTCKNTKEGASFRIKIKHNKS